MLQVLRLHSVSAAWQKYTTEQRDFIWAPNLRPASSRCLGSHLALTFDRYAIGDVNAVALAEHFPADLTHLDLNFQDCKIGDDGAIAVAENIPAGVTHLDLNFVGCAIGEGRERHLLEGVGS